MAAAPAGASATPDRFDINMPFLDGFELLSLAEKQESSATASIPVILLSGSMDNDMLARAAGLGARIS